MQCGLLGHRLAHSFSPQIHRILGDYSYELWEIEPNNLADFFAKRDFDACNVTIPYKKEVLPYCDSLTPLAQRIGTVNTIIKNSDGKLIGHNTDYLGFLYMLQISQLDVSNKKVLVLGSGGASATVCAALQDKKANVIIISRSGKNHYGNLDLHYDASLIVNTTPVGMYPKNGHSPIDLSGFSNLEGVIDLIYNPLRTQLLMNAERMGIPALNGMLMLIAQAKAAAELFTDTQISDDVIIDIYRKLKKQTQNLILVGMSSAGKSTVGTHYANLKELNFVDSDEEIEKKTGMSAAEYILCHGEAAFRQIESEVLEDLGKRSSHVIATGGGCVTNAANYNSLHQNGNICWIKRDLKYLSSQDRPLSYQFGIEELYHARQALYEYFADYSISNNADLQSALCQIEQMENVL